MIRRSAILVLLLLLAGCSPRVPVAPATARGQDPHATAPGDWRGRGRIEVAALGRRFSAGCLVRGKAGAARVVVLSDEGLVLADLEIGPAGLTVHRVTQAFQPRVARLAGLIAPYARLPEAQRTWRRGVLRATTAGDVRCYGGDPLLLRRIEGRGWPLTVSDYAAVAGGWVPRLVAADGPFGAELRLRLTELGPLGAPPNR